MRRNVYTLLTNDDEQGNACAVERENCDRTSTSFDLAVRCAFECQARNVWRFERTNYFQVQK